MLLKILACQYSIIELIIESLCQHDIIIYIYIYIYIYNLLIINNNTQKYL